MEILAVITTIWSGGTSNGDSTLDYGNYGDRSYRNVKINK